MTTNKNNKKRNYTVELVDLTKSFPGLAAVNHLDLNIQRGSIFALLGPNGSGKTTTINMAAGLIPPTSGDVLVCGHSIIASPIKVKQNIGVVPEDLGLFRMISLWEHMQIAGSIYGLTGKETEERSEKLLRMLDLWQDKDKITDFASFGMKKKLSIAMSLIHSPAVLFLDEPFKGIDPVASRIIRELLVELSQKGVTIFLTSHLTAKLERMIDQYAIIAAGKMVRHAFIEEDERSQINLEDIFFQFIEVPEKPGLNWLDGKVVLCQL